MFLEPYEMLHFSSATYITFLRKLLIYLTFVLLIFFSQELYLMIKETSMPKKEFVFGSVLIECTRGVQFSLIIYIHQWK